MTKAELTLIRVGHHLWRELKTARRAGYPLPGKKSAHIAPLSVLGALETALESVWETKRRFRAEWRKHASEDS